MKNWHVLLTCVFVSALIWLVMNLSRLNTQMESVPVLAVSNIDGFSTRALSETNITAVCKASGFKLIGLSSIGKPVEVEFDSSDLKPIGEDSFTIDQGDLYKYVQDIFGPGVSIESFVSQKTVFRFSPVKFRKLPVKAVKNIEFEPEYMAVSPIRFTPDSVLVYGKESDLSSIDEIRTEPIVKKSVKRDLHGTVGLQMPQSVRLSDSHVDYYVPVSRYVELNMPMKVAVRHLPSSTRLSVFPSTVNVTLLCAFPMKRNPFETASCFVDYRSFRNSLSGSCLVSIDGLPNGVIEYRVEPEVCDCVESSL